MEAGEAVGRLAGEQLVRSEQSLDRHRHRMVTGARSLLDRHAERLVHRARTLRGSARGQVETHMHLVGAQGGVLARASVRSLDTGRAALDRRARAIGRPARPATACRGAPGGPVAEAARGLRLPPPARTGLLGHPGRLRPGGPLVAQLPPGSRMHTRLADGEVASIVSEDGTDGHRHDTTTTPPPRRRRDAVMATTQGSGDGAHRGRIGGRGPELLRGGGPAGRHHRGVRDRCGRRRPPRRAAGAGHRHRGRARPPTPPHPDAGGGAGSPARVHRAVESHPSRTTTRTREPAVTEDRRGVAAGPVLSGPGFADASPVSGCCGRSSAQ